MKIIAITLTLYFSIFAACNIYAGNNTLTASFPTSLGTSNTIVLNTQTGSLDTTNTNCTTGLKGSIFSTSSNALQLCAIGNNGATVEVSVPYNETCFNRFCSCSAGVCTGLCTANPTNPLNNGLTTTSTTYVNPCPAGYFQATSGSGVTPLVDTMPTNGTYSVYSTVCCNGNGTPSGNATVVPTQ